MMRESTKRRILEMGLRLEDFEPKKEEVSVEDLLEAVNLLAEMIFEREAEE